jgi:hypothetical protein
MAFAHGKSTRVLFNDTDLSPFLNACSVARSQELAETTTFGATAKTFLAGFGDGTISAEGYWDGAPDAVDEVFAAAIAADGTHALTIARSGLTAPGEVAELAAVKHTSYEVSAGISDVTSVSAEFQASGAVRTGTVLHALEAETATGNDTAVDGGAATTGGAVAHLHVTAASAGDTLDVIVEDSADGSTGWATIGTFTQVGAVPASERITIAGTVRRYTRASWTIGGGTPSYTFVVALART